MCDNGGHCLWMMLQEQGKCCTGIFSSQSNGRIFYLFKLIVPLTRKIYLNTHLPQILVSASILLINREECAMVLYTMIKGPLLTVV
jgi:hypothetical protein